MDQPRFVELAQDREDAAGAVHVLDVVAGRRRDLADARHLARQAVDVGHLEIDARFLGHRQNVQHGVGRAAHGDVERHRVLERLEGRDAAREDRRIALDVVAPGHLDDALAGRLEQLPAQGVRRQQRAVARQRQAERLVQAIHAVGGEHAGARAAGRAGRTLHLPERSSLTLASLEAIIESIRSSLRISGLPSRSWVPTILPASIGPPETKMVGMLSRIVASSMPGVILSQFEMHTSASAQCAFTMYSTLSAINSRLGSEYSIPPCPMAMPSSTAMVLNSTPQPPWRRSPF